MQQTTDTLTDTAIGLLGGAIGVMAMDLFSQQIMPMLTQASNDDQEQRSQQQNGQRQNGQRSGSQAHALDSLAVTGRQFRQNESSTDALGRIVYHWLTGDDPDKETKSELSYAVHWGYGITQGGVYGAVRSQTNDLDLLGGAAFGTALWLLGDEIAVPMLGLQKGPTAYAPGTHLNRLASHVVYGMATAAATQLLRKTVS